MRLIFLGTAGSWPTKERSASAIAVGLDRELVLLDCGEGTQRQFFHSSASFMRVRRVFLTHFHGDHFLGLPGLLQSMGLNHRTDPLDIYGPPDATEIVGQVLRLGHHIIRFPIEVHALRPGDSVELDGYTLRTAAADHPVPALAYRLEEPARRGRFDGDLARSLGIHGPDFTRLEQGETVTTERGPVHPADVMGPPRPGRSLVYTGDTAPAETVRKLADGATLLIHEATTAADLEAEANAWGHSSARQAAEIALAARVGGLYLTHFSARYKELDGLEAEAKALFASAKAARDLLEDNVPQP